MTDRRGITSFLLITFGITYLIEIILILTGFRMTALPPLFGQLVIAGVMWVPALAVVLTVKFITKEGFKGSNIRIGSLKLYLASALTIPAVFAVIYGLTWWMGQGAPDLELQNFMGLLASAGENIENVPPPKVILLTLFLVSIVIGPVINGIFGFGEELGWRGYLLPKLIHLGKLKAYLILGVIWGLWHAPLVLIGFNYPGYPVAGVLMMVLLTTVLGIYLNEMTLRGQSSILAGWIHGAINGQAYGIWRVLFPDVNPILGGMTGLVGILVFLVLGFGMVLRNRGGMIDGNL